MNWIRPPCPPPVTGLSGYYVVKLKAMLVFLDACIWMLVMTKLQRRLVPPNSLSMFELDYSLRDSIAELYLEVSDFFQEIDNQTTPLILLNRYVDYIYVEAKALCNQLLRIQNEIVGDELETTDEEPDV